MRNLNDPSLIRSSGYQHRPQQYIPNKTITVINNNYLKNISEELLTEESANGESNNNNEIIYIRAEVNGIPTEVMIDTGANVSLIDSTELDRIQRECKKIIPTLPVNNITIIRATGCQNKSVRNQVLLEVKSNGSTIPMIFLVPKDLPFNLLVGCDMLRQYSVSYTHLDVYKRQLLTVLSHF